LFAFAAPKLPLNALISGSLTRVSRDQDRAGDPDQ